METGGVMNTIFIVSSDKMSIRRFIQFILKYLQGYEVGTLHTLMTIESLNLYIEDFFKKYPKRIISYYMRKINQNPVSILPEGITQNADLIIWFSLYSLKPEVIQSKSDPHILKGALMDWERHIKALEAMKGGL